MSQVFYNLTEFNSIHYVSEAKKKELIPKKFHHIFQDNCSCGEARVVRITENRPTMITCTDPHCIYKVSNQLENIFKNFQFKDFAETTFRNMLEELPVEHRTVYSILCADPEVIPFTGKKKEQFINYIKEFRSNKLSLDELIKRLHYPFITGKHIEALVENYERNIQLLTSSYISEFLETYKINWTLGMYNLWFFSPTIQAIVEFCKHYKMIIPKKATCRVCITGKGIVFKGVKVTKKEFIKRLNFMIIEFYQLRGLDTLLEINEVDSVSAADFVVVTEDAWNKQTSKFLAAMNIQKRRELSKDLDFLYKADDFIRFVGTLLKKIINEETSEG